LLLFWDAYKEWHTTDCNKYVKQAKVDEEQDLNGDPDKKYSSYPENTMEQGPS
jgi:hypothetical protein